MARRTGSQRQLGYTLDNLVDIRLQTGDIEGAAVAYAETATVVRDSGDRRLQAIVLVHGAQLALARGEVDEAMGGLARAAAMFAEVGPADVPLVLAWLAAARLAAGDVAAALAATAESLAALERDWRHVGVVRPRMSGGGATRRCERRRQRSAAGRRSPPRTDRAGVGGPGPRATAMLEVIAGLNDDGLRRNYLNKIPLNRQIVREVAGGGAEYGLSLEPLTTGLSGPGGGEEQFRRLLDIGVRLNEGRGGAELPRQIMNEVVETHRRRARRAGPDGCGGRRRVAAQISPVRMWELGPDGFLPPASTGDVSLEEIAPLLDECERKGSPLLRYMPEGAVPLEQRSILVVPLVAVGKLAGFIYTELDGRFGRFHEHDRDLLSVLANQAAVAVENAELGGHAGAACAPSARPS